MKKLPTALTVPSNSFQVWLTIAPPLDASVAGARQGYALAQILAGRGWT